QRWRRTEARPENGRGARQVDAGSPRDPPAAHSCPAAERALPRYHQGRDVRRLAGSGSMASGFEGFGPKALPFFKALAFHQSKVWFDENRALYDRDVIAPMLALLDELNRRFAKAKLPLTSDGKKSIFR